MSRMYFDIWAANDYEGTSLGELTQAFDKEIEDPDQAIGHGSFRINRHDSQAAWCVPRALVRVRRVGGGPFAFDSANYFFAFFIEVSADIALSGEEEGGEVLTRGGDSIISYLKRAVIYPGAEISGHRSYWSQGRITGQVIFPNKTVGEALRILILNAKQRVPDPLEGLTLTWTDVNDSSGTPWPDTAVDWKFSVGTDLLKVLSSLVSSQSYFRITPDMVLSAWDEHPGTDLSASISFTKGVDLEDASEKKIDARGVISRALVQGGVLNNRIQFFQAIDAAWEATIGRIEGFVLNKTTTHSGRLVRSGLQAVTKARLQHDGPTTSAVTESAGKTPYVDYIPGDEVEVDIPGIYEEEKVRIAAIILKDADNGEYDIFLEFNDAPFDPATGPTFDTPTGPSEGGCGNCPQPTPFVPGTELDDTVDLNLSFGTVTDGGGTGPLPFSNPSFANDGNAGTVTANGAFVAAPSFRYLKTDLGSPRFVAGMKVIGDWECGNNPVPVDGITIEKSDDGSSWSSAGSAKEFIVGGGGVPQHTNFVLNAGATARYWWLKTLAPTNGFNCGTTISTWAIWGGSAGTPAEGQEVGEFATDPPVSGVYTTNYPYIPGTLRVWVAGVEIGINEIDPEAGTWSFPAGFDPGTAEIRVRYQIFDVTPTGATNDPIGSGSSTIPPSLLPDDKWKQPVRVAATGNVVIATGLNAGDTIDGSTLAAGDRVLLPAQTTGAENGIYVAGVTPVRAADFDASADVLGSRVAVIEGTANAGKTFRVSNTAAVTLGTTAITFVEVTGGVTDHGALTGLGDDDHPQYATNAEFDAHTHGQSGLTGHYEVIVSGTAPPVAVTNVAEDDWLYGWVAD
jgi:hypothetical protein